MSFKSQNVRSKCEPSFIERIYRYYCQINPLGGVLKSAAVVPMLLPDKSFLSPPCCQNIYIQKLSHLFSFCSVRWRSSSAVSKPAQRGNPTRLPCTLLQEMDEWRPYGHRRNSPCMRRLQRQYDHCITGFSHRRQHTVRTHLLTHSLM